MVVEEIVVVKVVLVEVVVVVVITVVVVTTVEVDVVEVVVGIVVVIAASLEEQKRGDREPELKALLLLLKVCERRVLSLKEEGW